ncbi:MAG: hypothetical protein IKI49_04715, partial [Oscillospiraceae bacterium]|nr:hypothetical protein [Oscillospiraceae bacterium]
MKVKKLLCIILAVVLIAGVAAVPASAADPIDIKDAYTDTALPSEVVYGDQRAMFRLLIDTPSAKMVELERGEGYDYVIDFDNTTIDGKSITDEHDLYSGIAGKYHVVLKGIGNYTGTFTLDVTVKKAPIDGTVYIEAGKGTIQAGTVLTAKYKGNAEVEYKWLKNGMYIANATSETYTIPAGAVNGEKFTVEVTAKADDPFYTGSIESRPVVVGSTVLSGMVFINDENGQAYGYNALSGIYEANVGDVLTAEFINSDNLTSPTYDWVWYRGDEVIGNNNTYTVTTVDYSSTITLRAVGKGNFSGEVLSENYVWINSGEPSITLRAY